MKVNIYILTTLFITFSGIITWYAFHDEVFCIVQNGGSADGYYVAIGGIYIKRGYDFANIPDIFDLYNIHRYWSKDAYYIAQDKHQWGIFTFPHKQIQFTAIPKNPEKYIFFPPSEGWTSKNSDFKMFSPIVSHCKGSLADSPSLQSRQTNIEQMMQQPVASFLCVLLCVIAYYIWDKGVEVSAVSFSYDSVVGAGEYWRIITASLSHFDILHLGFNVMSLYQLGTLEPLYGSPTYLYLTINLIFITIFICIIITHVLIYYYNHTTMAAQQSIGFSCVLFAWMVAMSVQLDQYCPLFFYPSLCFKTFHITIPFTSHHHGLLVNFGTVVLLIITKIIIPRSSFLGHLSGILIGYPLAWGMLEWLKPSLLCVILSWIVIYVCKLFVWQFSGYGNNTAPDADMYSISTIWKYNPLLIQNTEDSSIYRYVRCLYFLLITYMVLTSMMLYYIYGLWNISEFTSRISLIVFVYFSIYAMKCERITSIGAVKHDCIKIIMITTIISFIFFFIDLMFCIGIYCNRMMLLYSGSSYSTMSTNRINMALGILICSILTEWFIFSLLVLILQHIPSSSHYLSCAGLDAKSMERFCTSTLGVYYFHSAPIPTIPFQGISRTLPSVALSSISSSQTAISARSHAHDIATRISNGIVNARGRSDIHSSFISNQRKNHNREEAVLEMGADGDVEGGGGRCGEGDGDKDGEDDGENNDEDARLLPLSEPASARGRLGYSNSYSNSNSDGSTSLVLNASSSAIRAVISGKIEMKSSRGMSQAAIDARNAALNRHAHK